MRRIQLVAMDVLPRQGRTATQTPPQPSSSHKHTYGLRVRVSTRTVTATISRPGGTHHRFGPCGLPARPGWHMGMGSGGGRGQYHTLEPLQHVSARGWFFFFFLWPERSVLARTALLSLPSGSGNMANGEAQKSANEDMPWTRPLVDRWGGDQSPIAWAIHGHRPSRPPTCGI